MMEYAALAAQIAQMQAEVNAQKSDLDLAQKTMMQELQQKAMTYNKPVSAYKQQSIASFNQAAPKETDWAAKVEEYQAMETKYHNLKIEALRNQLDKDLKQ